MTSETNKTEKILIMGAAGRDFHDFNVYWKNAPNTRVVCFTATQIPNIDGRVYPAELAGPAYPEGIPIHPEPELEELIARHEIDRVAFAYSDVPHEYVMHMAARVNAAGAGFCTLGARQTMIKSTKPVIAVCAVRTGCGKSQTSRRISTILHDLGKKVAVVRHPMPYGDLARQACQRYAAISDMDLHECTIEEREEYERHIEAGNLIFAGVDYERILRAAEEEADVILWDGGNNDLSFYLPDLLITVVDPHRPGHELKYYPGETNLRLADIVIVNKVDTADANDIAIVEDNIRATNPNAIVVRADSPVTASNPEAIKGKRVLIIEDGPTLTHGEMRYGAGYVAAKNLGAGEIIDPRAYARGSIRAVFDKYDHLQGILPAMGYGEKQIAELEATVNAVPCDLVIVATPIDLTRILKIDKPTTVIRYELAEHDASILPREVARAVGAS